MCLTVFHCFPPFMTKSELQQPLFPPLLFFKEWREKFALVTLYKIETGSLLLQSLLTKEQPCLIRSHCSLQKSNGSDSLFSKSESLFRSFAHKKRAIRSKKTKSKFPPLTNTEWSRILKLQIRISNIFVKTIILRKLSVVIRVEWFWEKKMLNIVCCAKLLLDPNSEISCLKVVSFLGRRAFEKLDCPKSTKFFVLPFWSLRQGKMYS